MSELDNPEIYRSVLESLQTGIYFVDRDQKILFWNEGAERITGYLRQDVVGRFCRDNLLAGGSQTSVIPDAAKMLAAVLRDGRPSMADVSLQHKEGHRIYVRLRAVAIRNSHGTIIGAAESFDEDISSSEWDRRQSKLVEYGCIDHLTGVLNEDFMRSRLRESLVTYAEQHVPFGVLRIRVDRLDHLRANYGMAIVAAVLKVVGHTLENSVRPTDYLGRIEDNEFVAVLTECDAEEIQATADRLKKMVAASQIHWWGDHWAVTASIGATTVQSDDTSETLLERTEKALAEAVSAGGNRITMCAA